MTHNHDPHGLSPVPGFCPGYAIVSVSGILTDVQGIHHRALAVFEHRKTDPLTLALDVWDLETKERHDRRFLARRTLIHMRDLGFGGTGAITGERDRNLYRFMLDTGQLLLTVQALILDQFLHSCELVCAAGSIEEQCIVTMQAEQAAQQLLPN